MSTTSVALADEVDKDATGTVETVTDAVRVTLVKSGGEHTVTSVRGGGGGQVCSWSVVFAPVLVTAPGPSPHPDARLALLLCNGVIDRTIWVAPTDVVDLDAAAQVEAQRYVEDVLVPTIRIGVNPAARGLVGLESWFWIDGFTGSVQAPPISAFGVTIDVRMSSGTVTWSFGDGTTEAGDLGRAYPAESSVQHAHQHDGTFTITAVVDLVPEYRVGAGPWLTLPGLQVTATAPHEVEERQAVVTGA